MAESYEYITPKANREIGNDLKMWSPLNTLSDSCFEHLANLLDQDTRILSATLKIVSTREYAPLLSIVVSMGRPSLTSALEYDSAHHYWHHPGVGLGVQERHSLHMSYYPGGDHTSRTTAWRTANSPEAGAEFIDLIMIQMPHDTKRIEAKIADVSLARRNTTKCSS